MSSEEPVSAEEFPFGRLASRSDYQKILDVWQSRCLKNSVELSSELLDKFRERLAACKSGNVFSVLDVAVATDTEAIKLLVEVLAMRPIIVKLDMTNNLLPNELLKLMLRLLRGQAKLAKTIAVDDRLQAGFLGEVLFDYCDDVEQSLLDEIWLVSGALKLCNAQSHIRAQFLHLQVEEPVSYEDLFRLWLEIFGEADEQATEEYMQDAFSFAALLYKMYDPLSYEEVEAVLLSGFITQGFVDVPSTKQLNVIGYTSEWLVTKIEEIEYQQKFPAEPVIPVVELTLPDDELFDPEEDRAATPGTPETPPKSPPAENNVVDYTENSSAASPARLVTASLFAAKYLKKTMSNASNHGTPSTVQDVPPPPPAHSSEGNEANVRSASVQPAKDELLVRYDQILALQQAAAATTQLPPAPHSARGSHEYLHPQPDGRDSSRTASNTRDSLNGSFRASGDDVVGEHLPRRSTPAHEKYSAPSPSFSRAPNYRHAQEYPLDASIYGSGMRNGRSFDAGEGSPYGTQRSTPSRHFYPVRTISELSDAGGEGSYVSTHTGDRDRICSNSQLEVDVGPSSFLLDFTASASPSKLSVHTLCNVSHTDGELAELLSAQSNASQKDISVLILRNNDVSYVERLNLGFRFPYLTDLDLSCNTIVGSVRGLPQTLLRLDLSHNRITNVSGVLNCVDLVELNLSHNDIKSFHSLPAKLERVNLSHNCISAKTTLRALALSADIVSLDLTENAVLLESKDWRVLLVTLLPRMVELNGKPLAFMKKAPKEGPERSREAPAISCAKRTASVTRDDQRVCDSVRTLHVPQDETIVQQAQEYYLSKVIKRSAILKPQQIQELTHRLTHPTSSYRNRSYPSPRMDASGRSSNSQESFQDSPRRQGNTSRTGRPSNGRKLDNSRNRTEFYSRSGAPDFVSGRADYSQGDNFSPHGGGADSWSYDSRLENAAAARRWETRYGETKAGIEAYPTGYGDGYGDLDIESLPDDASSQGVLVAGEAEAQTHVEGWSPAPAHAMPTVARPETNSQRQEIPFSEGLLQPATASQYLYDVEPVPPPARSQFFAAPQAGNASFSKDKDPTEAQASTVPSTSAPWQENTLPSSISTVSGGDLRGSGALGTERDDTGKVPSARSSQDQLSPPIKPFVKEELNPDYTKKDLPSQEYQENLAQESNISSLVVTPLSLSSLPSQESFNHASVSAQGGTGSAASSPVPESSGTSTPKLAAVAGVLPVVMSVKERLLARMAKSKA